MLLYFDGTRHYIIAFLGDQMDNNFETALLRVVLEYYFLVEGEDGWVGHDIICDFLILVAQVHAAQKFNVEWDCIYCQMQLWHHGLLWNILHFVNNYIF